MDFKALLHQISQIYQKLSLKQKIVAGSSIVLVVAFLVFLTLYKSKSDSFAGYSVLFENISPSDSALIVDQLNKDGIKYKLANEGTILVSTSDVYKERIAVATLGIPKESKIGFEIFDKQEFGATDAEQRVKFQRALEGELARTIESLSSIQKATVRIAIPKESVFTERQALPTASIVVELKPGVSLNAKQIFGIKKNTFDKMLKLLNESYRIEHLRGGHPPKLSVLDRLVIMLSYYRDYRTMENIAFEYGVAKSTICECIKWVENILIKSEEFSLPKKRELVRDTEIEVVLVDATECEIECPEKNSGNIIQEKEKTYYKGSDSGRRKGFKDTQRIVFARKRS